jgi:hypothetical protein
MSQVQQVESQPISFDLQLSTIRLLVTSLEALSQHASPEQLAAVAGDMGEAERALRRASDALGAALGLGAKELLDSAGEPPAEDTPTGVSVEGSSGGLLVAFIAADNRVLNSQVMDLTTAVGLYNMLGSALRGLLSGWEG